MFFLVLICVLPKTTLKEVIGFFKYNAMKCIPYPSKNYNMSRKEKEKERGVSGEMRVSNSFKIPSLI